MDDVELPIRQWVCDDGNAEVVIEADTREHAAQEYVDDGDWGNVDQTIWINVYVHPIEDPEDRSSHKIAVDPEEPECPEGEHDWIAPYDVVGGCKSNPGVWGSGGGVTIGEVCLHCGCSRHTDTWAQDPSDGTQGLTSVCYSDEYKDAWEAWCRQERIQSVPEVELPSEDDFPEEGKVHLYLDMSDEDTPQIAVWDCSHQGLPAPAHDKFWRQLKCFLEIEYSGVGVISALEQCKDELRLLASCYLGRFPVANGFKGAWDDKASEFKSEFDAKFDEFEFA